MFYILCNKDIQQQEFKQHLKSEHNIKSVRAFNCGDFFTSLRSDLSIGDHNRNKISKNKDEKRYLTIIEINLPRYKIKMNKI